MDNLSRHFPDSILFQNIEEISKFPNKPDAEIKANFGSLKIDNQPNIDFAEFKDTLTLMDQTIKMAKRIFENNYAKFMEGKATNENINAIKDSYQKELGMLDGLQNISKVYNEKLKNDDSNSKQKLNEILKSYTQTVKMHRALFKEFEKMSKSIPEDSIIFTKSTIGTDNLLKAVNMDEVQASNQISSEKVDLSKQLPKYVFSKNGSLGIDHLLYYLNTEKPSNRDEIIKWSFSQRKFQSAGSLKDTMGFDPTLFGTEFFSLGKSGLYTDKKGYAISLSDHSPHNAKEFLPKERINNVGSCVRYKLLSNPKLLIGYYDDNKCIIHQPGVRSCVPTALSMILHDKGVNFDFEDLYLVSIAGDELIKNLANNYGYELVYLKNDLKEVQEWINTNGSLLAEISHPHIGNHEIVVDSIDKDLVTIRDPAEGRRITFDTQEFLKTMIPNFAGIRKVDKET